MDLMDIEGSSSFLGENELFMEDDPYYGVRFVEKKISAMGFNDFYTINKSDNSLNIFDEQGLIETLPLIK